MFELLIIAVCLFLNALLAGAEMAFVATNKASLQSRKKKDGKKVKILEKLKDNTEWTLSTIQIGITFVGAFAAATGGAGVQTRLTPWLTDRFDISWRIAELISVAVVVLPLTYASVVLGELVPKTLALRNPAETAIKAAPWLNVFGKVINPLVKIFEWSTKKLVHLFPKESSKMEEFSLEGHISPENKQYILNMAAIERLTAEDILLEWDRVEKLNAGDSIDEVEEKIITSGHTRLPVVEEGEVVGLINSKEFFAFRKTEKREWASLEREPLKLQKNTFILKVLRELQALSTHMAVIYDGDKIMGIVTLEDIFEEIVGDIYDEDDFGSRQKILRRTRYRA